MPKEKGSKKSGGRVKLPEGARVVFYERCTPEKKEYLKEKSGEYEINKELRKGL